MMLRSRLSRLRGSFGAAALLVAALVAGGIVSVVPAAVAQDSSSTGAALRTYCATSSGDTAAEFCFEGPEKVVKGEDIVIRGTSGFLATDDQTGSVVNFFLDALYSGDPNTVYSKQTFTNPATGQEIGDHRVHGVVQADSDGTWIVTIKWPTVDNLATDASGGGTWTQQEIDERFAVGSTHSIRVLSGSLLPSPQDRQRGASLYFTVVDSLDDVTGVTEPTYDHQTQQFDDGAVAWAPTNVDSGSSFQLLGKDWLTADGAGGSTVTVRLVDEEGEFYRHAGSEDDPYPVSDDPTVWQIAQAGENGDLDASVAVPGDATAGDSLALVINTGEDTAQGDVVRHWQADPFTIDETPYVPPVDEDASCKDTDSYNHELAPGMDVAAAHIGGTIRLTGSGFCNLVGTGSLIGVKLNAGGISHTGETTAAYWSQREQAWLRDVDASGDGTVTDYEHSEAPSETPHSNQSVWIVIEADEQGEFDVEIPLPDGTDSTPQVEVGGTYTLQLLTRTIAADPFYGGTRPDPSRTIVTREFTLADPDAELGDVTPGRPTSAPDVLSADSLTDATRGGVSIVSRTEQTITLRVPGVAEGEWVWPGMYEGLSPRTVWKDWYQVGADGLVTLPLTAVTLPTGITKLAFQDRDAALVGWTEIEGAASVEVGADDAGAASATTTVLATSTTSVLSAATAVSAPSNRLAAIASAAVGTAPKPEGTPAAPVASYSDLGDGNVGGITATQDGAVVTITVPSVAPGDWLFVYAYADGRDPVPIGWAQVDSDRQLRVDTTGLLAGEYKLSLSAADGTLVGWALATVAGAVTGTSMLGSSSLEASGAEANDPTTAAGVWNLALFLAALAVLILGAAVAVGLVLRRRGGAR